MIADWFAGHELVLAISILVNTWPIGIALALLVLGDVAGAYGSGAAFGITAVLGAASLFLLAVAYRSPASASAERGAGLGAIDRREWKLLIVAGAAWMVFNVVYAMLASFLPLIMIEQGADATEANRLTALMSLLIIGSVPAGGWLAQRTGRPVLIAVASLSVTAVLLVAMHLLGPGVPLLLLTGMVIACRSGPWSRRRPSSCGSRPVPWARRVPYAVLRRHGLAAGGDRRGRARPRVGQPCADDRGAMVVLTAGLTGVARWWSAVPASPRAGSLGF